MNPCSAQVKKLQMGQLARPQQVAKTFLTKCYSKDSILGRIKIENFGRDSSTNH